MQKNSIIGISVGINGAFGKGRYVNGVSFALLYDGEKFAGSMTVNKNPSKRSLAYSVSLSAIEITSNNGNKVQFSDLKEEGIEYNLGLGIVDYTIGGSPDYTRWKPSTYKMQTLGWSYGLPISYGVYDTFTKVYEF